MKRRCDILNRRNLDYLTLDTLSPTNYNPRPEKVKKFTGAFTCRGRFKRAEEYAIEKRSGPGPQVYSIDEKLTKPTRYTDLLAGGHAPKDGLIIDKYPGPGTYDNPDNIAEKVVRHIKNSKSSLMN